MFYVSLFEANGLGDISIFSSNARDGYGLDNVRVANVASPGTLGLPANAVSVARAPLTAVPHRPAGRSCLPPWYHAPRLAGICMITHPRLKTLMAIQSFDRLRCPLDVYPLQKEQGCWRCSDGHSFDIARQGYVHLLPVQKKRSLDPGDSKDMVSARQRFLNAGYYQPIAEAVNRAVLAGSTAGKTLSCLDAGCGEGYYLRALAGAAAEGPDLELVGLDISKWAVMVAARQDKQPSWVVGSNANLPVEDASLDRLLCLFGFPVYAEFARVLKPGGQVLRVDAAAGHLRELREIIYPSLKPERQQSPDVPQGFRELAAESVNFALTLNSRDTIADLLAMTPHLYRASAEGRARAAALTDLSVTVSVQLTRLERVG